MHVSPPTRIARRRTLAPACLLLLVAFGQPSAGRQDCSIVANPSLRTLWQPDGSEIHLYFRGTGLRHWYEDVDGFPVVRTAQGYVYARRGPGDGLVPTQEFVGGSDPFDLGLERRVVPGPRANTPRPPALDQQHLDEQGRPQQLLSTTGTIENLVILLRFSDHGPGGQDRTLPSAADVSTIMNAVGGDPSLAPTGSLRDYYLETSYGQLTVDSTVVGWIDLPESETYYANGNAGLTELTWDMITDGLSAADALVDFTDFDQDGDGWIDAISFLHSGYGAEWGGDDFYGTDFLDRIWSHKWTIPTWTSAEGVQVGDYHVSPGLWDVTGSDPGRIGVICHELAHFFGLPDLYDTDGGSFGTGNWCVMGLGSWGFDDSQLNPSHFSAWCKLKLGWVAPQTILPGSYDALEIENDPTLYMIDSGYPSGEYLLIENRQPVGFDALIPQGGLAIWHIDEGKGSFNFNDSNADEGFPGQFGWPDNDNHYRVALLQADGAFDLEEANNPGDAGDVYHAGMVSTLDSTTTPNTDAYQAGTILANLNRIEGVGASGASIPFTYVNTSAPTVLPISPPNAFTGVFYAEPIFGTGGIPPYSWSEFLEDPTYAVTDLGPGPFTGGGIPLGINADEGTWGFDLPFPFPYYQTVHPRVYVNPNGCIDLAPLDNESYNTTPFLRSLPRIAALWDDLTTGILPGQDVYVSTTPGSVRFRWQAESIESAQLTNHAITLYRDGRIRFDYGGGNTDLSPTVGISRAHSGDVELVDSHDGESSLASATSLEFELIGSQLPPGLSLSSAGVLYGVPVSSGVFEFRVRITDSLHRYDQKLTSVLVRSLFSKPVAFPQQPPATLLLPFFP